MTTSERCNLLTLGSALGRLPRRGAGALLRGEVRTWRLGAAVLLLLGAFGDHLTTHKVLSSGVGHEANPGVALLMDLLGVQGALTFGTLLSAVLALSLLTRWQNRSEAIVQYAALGLVPLKLLVTASNASIWLGS